MVRKSTAGRPCGRFLLSEDGRDKKWRRTGNRKWRQHSGMEGQDEREHLDGCVLGNFLNPVLQGRDPAGFSVPPGAWKLNTG